MSGSVITDTGTHQLTGTSGDDTLQGGTGDDTVQGGAGSDTVLFSTGDGHDTLQSTWDATAGKVDRLVLDVAHDAARFSRSGSDLLIQLAGTDQVTVKDFFYGDNPLNTFNPLQQIVFTDTRDDGKPWDIAWIVQQLTTGTTGNDSLRGTANADTLTGGAGNDTLDGGAGSDHYQFTVGDGQDTLTSSRDTTAGKVDTLVLSGITDPATDLILGTSGDDLVIRFKDRSTDKITVKDFLYKDPAYNPLQAIDYVDATATTRTLDLAGILKQLYAGTTGNDSLNGSSGADDIHGGAGNDTLDGRSGADTLTGGTGDDSLVGGTGSDTYVYNLGDGRDTLGYTSDSTAGKLNVLALGDTVKTTAELSFTRSGNSLVIGFSSSPADSITVDSFCFSGADTAYNPLQGIRFDALTGTDGQPAFWDLAQIQAKLPGSTSATNDGVFVGGKDAERVTGSSGDDTLIGNGGNDTLYGGSGSDVYRFKAGDGQDVIESSRDTTAGKTDTLELDGIAASALSFSRSGYALVIRFANSTDQVTVNDFFYQDDPSNAYNPLQKITFTDSTAPITIAEIIAQLTTGSTGNDTLTGTAGDDTLTGDAGDDLLNGGAGSDHYVFKTGDGHDTLTSPYDTATGKTDTLVLKSIAGEGSLLLGTAGDDLVIRFAGNSTDQVTVQDFLYRDRVDNGYNPLQAIEFSGGDSITLARILALLQQGSSGNDTVAGTSGADKITGGEGNDSLSGRGGDDTLAGGTGNDTLSGGAGNNTYVFQLGDGQDTLTYSTDTAAGRRNTLQLGSGITQTSQLGFTRVGSSLVIGIKALDGTGSDSITVENFGFDSTGSDAAYNPLQCIEFTGIANAGTGASSTVWELAAIRSAVASSANNATSGSTGTSGSDTLIGTSGDDTLIGHGGNDSLVGGLGSDHYEFSRGDGQDVIASTRDSTAGKTDTLVFTAADESKAIVGTNIGLSLSGSSLVIKVKDSTDQVTVQDFLYNGSATNAYNPLQQITFTDGSSWDLADILAHLTEGTKGNDSLVGTSGGDVLIGHAGNDTIQGGAGSDSYTFGLGDGHDTLASTYDATLGKVDTLALGTGFTAAGLRLGMSGTSLVIQFEGNTTDQITVQDFLYKARLANGYSPLQRITFADDPDGLLNAQDILDKLLAGTGRADSLSGTTGDDLIQGQDDDDVLVGETGNDTLYGGNGNDTLKGGTGDNVYRFGLGDDQDTLVSTYDSSSSRLNTIELLSDVVVSDAKLNIDGTDLVLRLNGQTGTNTDSITIEDFGFTDGKNDSFNPLQQIRFAGVADDQGNALTWNLGDIRSHISGGTYAGTDGANDTLLGTAYADAFTGGGGKDNLVGKAGADTLDGGAGDDSLQGGADDDLYRYHQGDGSDTISDYDTDSNTDTLDVSDGDATERINFDDLWFTRSGDDLLVRFYGSSDVITLEDWGTSDAWRIEKFTAYDEVWNKTRAINDDDVDTLTQALAGSSFPTTLSDKLDHLNIELAVWGSSTTSSASASDDPMRGDASNNTLSGLGGNDALYGAAGNDTLVGGAGDDTLMGGVGDDTYRYAAGDGEDVIVDYDRDGNADKLEWSDVYIGYLWMEMNGSDLILSVLNGSDKITLANWGDGAENAIETITASRYYNSGGVEIHQVATITNASVDALVAALASAHAADSSKSYSGILSDIGLKNYWSITTERV